MGLVKNAVCQRSPRGGAVLSRGWDVGVRRLRFEANRVIDKELSRGFTLVCWGYASCVGLNFIDV